MNQPDATPEEYAFAAFMVKLDALLSNFNASIFSENGIVYVDIDKNSQRIRIDFSNQLNAAEIFQKLGQLYPYVILPNKN